MKRPQSAKPGYRGYWGQASNDDIADSRAVKNRKQVHLMKPDLTTHDFARVLPKKITQDKQRLYSELLQMKQSLNEVSDENMRLKTKISILEKEKEKINRYIETVPEGGMSSKGNSRVNVYASRATQKENMMVRNLKKMVRAGKDENEYLKTENTKIKKTIKYTRINEIEIEKKMIVEENKRLSLILEDMNNHAGDVEALETENTELKKYLEEEIEENKQLTDEKQKYQEILEALEEKLKVETEKSQAKEKKLQRELALEKRRVGEVNRHLEDLRKELKSSQAAHADAIKKKSKPARPLSSHPGSGGVRAGTLGRGVSAAGSVVNKESVAETEAIKNKNRQLQEELKSIRVKLQESEYQLKKKTNEPSRRDKMPSKTENIAVEREKPNEKQKNCLGQREEEEGSDSRVVQYNGNLYGSDLPLPQEGPEPEESKTESAHEKPVPKIHKGEAGSKQEGPRMEDYEVEFDKDEEEEEYGDGDFEEDKAPTDAQIQKLKKDFEANEDQEELYRKEEKQPKKDKKSKKDHKKGKPKHEKAGYKPNKKILSEIKELLTYRMKAQRYPFSDLQTDIEAAESQEFNYADLCNMLVNEPFYLTSNYTKQLLNYCFEKQYIEPEEMLGARVLVAKLKKVVDHFELIDEEEEKEMILRISEMTSSYPAQLENAFDKIKNGEQTVAKDDLIAMFQTLELEQKYIELIVAELSLCSDDLQHLNYSGYFERFYFQNEENNAIEEEESEESYRHESRGRKGKGKASADEEDNTPFMLAPEQPIANKNINFDDDDIVSDDGNI